jgi:UTP--glucose-1-phosphate uridylyltransferase
MKVDVAVIPCAGSGTRMRPATRVLPKAMIPVVDRPVIQYVVEEAVEAGVGEIVFVLDDRPGDPVLRHFVEGKPIPGLQGVTFHAVRQDRPHGLGDAVGRAEGLIAGRPFLCLLSDMFPVPGLSFASRMIEVFDERALVALREVGPEMLDRYGIVAVGPRDGDLVEVIGAVEKPGPDQAPSNLGLIGRYVLPASVFDALREVDPGHGGEVQLTDAIDLLASREGARGLVVGEALLDIGVPAGLLEATAAVGLARDDLAPAFRSWLKRFFEA